MGAQGLWSGRNPCPCPGLSPTTAKISPSPEISIDVSFSALFFGRPFKTGLPKDCGSQKFIHFFNIKAHQAPFFHILTGDHMAPACATNRLIVLQFFAPHEAQTRPTWRPGGHGPPDFASRHDLLGLGEMIGFEFVSEI